MAEGFILTDAPALPSTGLRQEVAAVVKANVRQILTDAVADKLGHAYAVASGPVSFREVFMKHMGAFWGGHRAEGEDLANVCYEFLKRAWIDQYPNQSASAFLDAAHVPSQQSAAEFEREVDDAWEVEIAGDEASMRQHYEGSARVRKGKDIFSSAWQKTPPKPH